METADKPRFKMVPVNDAAKEMAAAELPADLQQAICQAFWAIRNKIPDFAIVVDQRNAESFQKSLEYHGQEPIIIAEQQRAGLVVRMVDKKNKAPIIQSESSLDDQASKEKAMKVRQSLDSIDGLLGSFERLGNDNVYSSGVVDELIDVVKVLRDEVRGR